MDDSVLLSGGEEAGGSCRISELDVSVPVCVCVFWSMSMAAAAEPLLARVIVCLGVCVCVYLHRDHSRGLLPQLREDSLYLNRQRCLLPNSSPVAGAAGAVSDLLMKITVLLPALPSLDWPIDRCQLSLGHRY